MPITPQNINTLKTKSVLCVEDNADLLEQLSFFLKPKVKALYTALNGKDALTLYEKYKPDAVISDISMPVMSGMDLTKAIRKSNQDIPIILISGYKEKYEALQEEDGIGNTSCILKPINPYLLVDAIVR